MSETLRRNYSQRFLNITIMSRNLLHLPTSVNSHQDTVSHILVVHQGMLCLCEFIIGFYIAMLLLNLRMIGDDRSELNLFMQHIIKFLHILCRSSILYITIAVDVFGLHLEEPDALGSFFCKI